MQADRVLYRIVRRDTMMPKKPIALVIDDDIVLLETMKLQLSEFVDVIPARGGKQALQSVSGQQIDVILLDIEMPVMNGYEATVAIRRLSNRIRANVPIIAITANAFHEDRELAAASGMDDFISKPMSTNRLLRCLMKYR